MTKKRILALTLGVCLIVGSINFYVFDVWDKISESYTLSKKDRQTAEEVASLTGRSADSLMQLKSQTGSWNDVIGNLGDEPVKLSDEDLRKFIEAEGYAQDEVSEAKMLAEQVSFNLQEILRNESPIEVAAVTLISEKDDVSETYKKIGQSFDENAAIYFALVLKDKLGSMQAVIDEYLYCLQIEVDLSLLIMDEQAYEKAVLEKSARLTRENAVTADDISARMLETLQPKKADDIKNEGNEPSKITASKSAVNPINNAPKDPRPADPAKEIMDDIDRINKSWMSGR